MQSLTPPARLRGTSLLTPSTESSPRYLIPSASANIRPASAEFVSKSTGLDSTSSTTTTTTTPTVENRLLARRRSRTLEDLTKTKYYHPSSSYFFSPRKQVESWKEKSNAWLADKGWSGRRRAGTDVATVAENECGELPQRQQQQMLSSSFKPHAHTIARSINVFAHFP